MIKKLKTALCALLACMVATSSLAACGGKSNGNVSEGSGDISPPTEQLPETDEEQTPPTGEEDEEQEEETQPEQPTKKWARYIRVTGDSVNIRSGAGTGASVIGRAEKGTMYAVTGEAGGFYKTTYRHQTAYISASYTYEFSLQKSDNAAVENVISEGYNLIGIPYVYGAVRVHDGYGNRLSSFNKNKFDCSSLTQFVFFYGAGVLLQTTTRTQVKQGKYVKKSELARGDCIYYTNETRYHLSGVERIGHVAIYLGEGFILHTASDYARIEKMSQTRWSYYIEARRFL